MSADNHDHNLGPLQQRYQLAYLEDFTGDVRRVSVNYDPETGRFGIVKFAGKDPSRGGGGGRR